MKKLINIALLLTSLIGYLEWGKGQHAFLFQVELDLLLKARGSTETFMHPLVFAPLIGQVIILFTLFQKEPGRKLTLFGLACLSTIMLMIFFIGLISLNVRIAGSATPFVVAAVFALRHNWKRKAGK